MSSLASWPPLTGSVVPEQPVLELDLPDPEQDDISTMEFLARLEQAWAICDRFDLQTEIWRGRILRAVRDREKRGGEGRGAGFLQWLREQEISKTRAYGLIQLAESADDLVGGGMLEQESVNQFSKRAFMETAQAAPEVQVMISEAANEGQEITRKQVRRLTDEFTAATSPLLLRRSGSALRRICCLPKLWLRWSASSPSSPMNSRMISARFCEMSRNWIGSKM